MARNTFAQHKQCAAPITACAPFSLLAPHQCPTPIRALKFPTNLTARLRRREWANAPGWFDGRRRADRHFVYSRFRPLRTIRAGTEIHNAFTAVSFLHGVSDQIVIGTNSGEIRMYDTNNSDVLEVSGKAPAGAVRKIAPTGAGAPQPIFAVTSDASCSIWSLPNPEEAPVILYEDEDAFGCALNSVGSQFVIGSVDGVDIIDMETQVSARRLASKMDGPASLTKKKTTTSPSLPTTVYSYGTKPCGIYVSPKTSPSAVSTASPTSPARVSIPTATKSSSVARSGTFAPLASFAPFHPSTAPRSSSTPPAPSPWRGVSTSGSGRGRFLEPLSPSGSGLILLFLTSRLL